MAYVIQSIVLRRDRMTKDRAYDWMREHGYITTNMEVSPTYYHFQQVESDRLRAGRCRSLGLLGNIGYLVLVYF